MTLLNLKSGSRPVDEAKPAAEDSAYGLNLVLVYEDSLTRTWAVESFEAVPRAGQAQVQLAEWRIHGLLEAKNFPDSVGAAARADIIVVALHAADELPIPLYVWIDAWLPRRSQRAGALVAWIGLADPSDADSSHVQQYLHAVARRAGLDFLPNECRRPTEPVGFPPWPGSANLPPPRATSSAEPSGLVLAPAATGK